MAGILYVRDKTGKFIPIPALVGPKGDPGDIKDLTINGKKPEAGALTLTAEDVGALGKNAQAKDSSKLGGKAPEYYVQPRNLLDNSDFTNPVTQRGSGTVSAKYGYPLDRWQFDKSSETLDANSSFNPSYPYLVLRNNDSTSGSWAALYHRVPAEALHAGKYTFAFKMHYNNSMINPVSVLILMDGNITVLPSALYEPDKNKDLIIVIPFTLDKKPTTSVLLAVYAVAGVTVGFDWAALYEGTYDVDTLPPYVPKGYEAELAECQRYYIPLGSESVWAYLTSCSICENANAVEAFIPTPVKMRILPSVSCVGKLRFMPGDEEITSFTPIRYLSNGIVIKFGCASLATGQIRLVQQYDAGYLELNADL